MRGPALIAGGGIAGLTLALALSRRGLPSRLFERAASGSSLTAKGQALVSHARFLLRGMARMDEVAKEHAASVRFGCIPRAMHTLMPFILNRMGPAPVHRLHVVEDASGVLSAALERGGLDMAVMRHVSGAAGIGGGLVAERLYERTGGRAIVFA